MTEKFPVPPSLWKKLCEFTQPGRHGKIELDVKDGKVVGMRLLESVRPTEGKEDSLGGIAA